MTISVYVAVYLGMAIFAVGCIGRILQYARTPVHLRWELYPVPHEEKDRAVHGGSYFESADWWTRPRQFNRLGELRSMLLEMLFLKGLWEFNRRLWYSSFLFHFGLYLVIASIVLTVVSATLAVLAPALLGGQLASLLAGVYRVAGAAGATLSLSGAVGLLYRRKTSTELRNYTTAADIFNLAFFITNLILLITGYFLRPPDTGVGGFVRGLITWDTSLRLGPVFSGGMVLASALAAYIPFTHMAHFIAKYFTYHAVRWDDRANLRGGSLESKMAAYIAYRPTWGAAHIGGDGQKTWAEIVTANPVQRAGK